AVAERALLVMLGAPEPAVRLTGARVAGRLFRAPLPGDDTPAARALPVTVGDALIALLNQPTALERLVAMESLGLARDVRAVSALTERHAYHVRNGPALERAATLDALARIGHPSSLELFTAALDDRWDALRQLGYEGLARLADRDGAAAALGARPRDRRAHVALAHAFARARLLAGEGMRDIIEALGASATRAQARGYLLELGGAVTAPLLGALGHHEAEVRAALAEVLGLAGTREALAPLTPLASDRSRTVAEAAARAISRIEAGLSSGTPRPR
ncbi:MAG: HEAT repeat domain-containing protein, partial [Vicinamibacterales bacterium]|nr:HEAT repeat domain-containing protein [Vicinamibacterales bacterium]